MPVARHPLLAREGWPHILIVGFAAVLIQWYAGFWFALPLWAALVFVVQFFRDPPRAVPGGAGLVICPADGKVVSVGAVEDPYLKRPALRVSVFMNVFNVHANRMPVTAQVRQIWYDKGRFLNAALDKSSEHNERNAVWLRTDDGRDVVVVQVAGLIARRILSYVQTNQRVERGERYGFIRFGSRVDVYLPADARARVGLGDKVKGGSDVVAEFADPGIR